MQRARTLLSLLCLTPLLGGCQYVSFFKTNTTSYRQDTGPEAVCEEMGATRGTAELDWCVRREELARGHDEFGF